MDSIRVTLIRTGRRWRDEGGTRLSHSRKILASLASALTLAGSIAVADTKRVTIGVDPTDGAGKLRPDRLLPASEAFDLVLLPPPAGLRVSASISIWPSLGKKCEGFLDGPQSYRLAFGKDESSGAFRAQVPPLQLGQPYCIRIAERLALGEDQVKGIAARAVATHPELVSSKEILLQPKVFKAVLSGAVVDAMGAANVQHGDVKAAANRVAEIAADAFLYSDAVRDYLKADTDLENARDLHSTLSSPGQAAAAAKLEADIDAMATRLPRTVGALSPALVKELESALKVIRLDHAFLTESQPTSVETVTYVNFASVDAGIVFGVPLVSGGTGLDALPYWGLNFYFTPVERKIPVSSLVGSDRDRFLQRFSLTGGLAFSAPKPRGYRTSAVVLGKAGLLAAGWRMTQYTRVTVGVLFFRATPESPADAHERLGVFPFVGYSADLDIIALARTGFGL